MIFFFDRDLGTCVPLALIQLHFNKQVHEIHYHQELFAIGESDDVWLPQVGK